MPEADPEVLKREKTKKNAQQQNRSASRASTILSDNSSETLG
ncbi:hypothetical protein AK973_1033 [Pseudomonas brassicacearum]|nr:hypothetical protein AK973_1033 [Pseudomonas brassicacearum]